MDDRYRESMERIQAAVERASAEVRRRREERERRSAADDDELEDLREEGSKAIRDGAAGPEAQRLRQRVDRGEFTWEDLDEGLVEDESVQALYERYLVRLDGRVEEITAELDL